MTAVPPGWDPVCNRRHREEPPEAEERYREIWEMIFTFSPVKLVDHSVSLGCKRAAFRIALVIFDLAFSRVDEQRREGLTLLASERWPGLPWGTIAATAEQMREAARFYGTSRDVLFTGARARLLRDFGPAETCLTVWFLPA